MPHELSFVITACKGCDPLINGFRFRWGALARERRHSRPEVRRLKRSYSRDEPASYHVPHVFITEGYAFHFYLGHFNYNYLPHDTVECEETIRCNVSIRANAKKYEFSTYVIMHPGGVG